MNKLEAQVIDLLKHRQHEKVDGLLLQYIEAPTNDPQFFKQLVGLLAKSKNKKRLNDFGDLLLESLLKKNKYRRAMKIARMLLKGLPERCEFLEQLLRCVRELNRNRPRIEEYIELAKFDENENVGGALRRLDLMLYNDEGEVFVHDIFHIGKVVASDPLERKATLKFENGESKEFTFAGVREYMRKIPAGHFHALRLKDPTRFREFAFNKPVEFMKVMLRSFNRELKVDELKAHLTDSLLGADGWRQWWKASRDPLLHDPYLEYSGGTRGLFSLRDTPREYHEELIDRFREDRAAAARAEILKEARKQFGETDRMKEIVGILEERLEEEFAKVPTADSEQTAAVKTAACIRRVEYAYLWEDLHERQESKLAGYDEFAELGDPATVAKRILGIEFFEYQCRALERFAGLHSETYPRFFIDIMRQSPPKLAAWIMKHLEASGNQGEMAEAAEKLLGASRENTEGCLWAMKQYFDGKWASFFDAEFPQIHVNDLLDTMEQLHNFADQTPEESSRLRGVVAKIRNFLWADHCEAMVKAIQELAVEEVRQLQKRISNHPAISDDFTAAAASAFRQARADLTAQQSETAIDKDVLYVSAKTLAERRKEYEHLNAVEIPKNSKAVGEAAALGDLSENAEYVAAKEHQKVLHARLEELGSQLLKARVIDLDSVRTDLITVGTCFAARNLESGEEATYTLLGIWDANPSENILSYRSPFAEQFMGKRTGEKATVQMPGAASASWEIVSIDKAEGA